MCVILQEVFFPLLADYEYREARGATRQKNPRSVHDHMEDHLPTRNNHIELSMSKKYNLIVLSRKDFGVYLLLKLVLFELI